jgi:tRNA U54 and U55 pseudouridine synthase Pus10
MVKNETKKKKSTKEAWARVISVKLHKTKDADILLKLAKTGNMNGYIKNLIRADIARGED